MYFIKKRTNLPEVYQTWLEINRDELNAQIEDSDITGTQMWNQHSDIADFPKKELGQAVLEDQGYICCYCGFPITNNETTFVIEHFKPKSLKEYKSLVFEYTNLFASCKGGSGNEIHFIQEGETIASIAKDKNLPIEYLTSINNGMKSLNGIRHIKLKNKVEHSEQHCDCSKGAIVLSLNLLNPGDFKTIYYSVNGKVLSGNLAIEKDIETLGLNNNFELNYLRLLSIERAIELFKKIRELDPEKQNETLNTLKEKYYNKNEETQKYRAFYFIYLSIWGI